MSNFSQAAREHLATIPLIALDPKETPTTRAATVAFTTSTYGINTPGTVYRMDDVPLPLRPAFDSRCRGGLGHRKLDDCRLSRDDGRG